MPLVVERGRVGDPDDRPLARKESCDRLPPRLLSRRVQEGEAFGSQLLRCRLDGGGALDLELEAGLGNRAVVGRTVGKQQRVAVAIHQTGGRPDKALGSIAIDWHVWTPYAAVGAVFEKPDRRDRARRVTSAAMCSRRIGNCRTPALILRRRGSTFLQMVELGGLEPPTSWVRSTRS